MDIEIKEATWENWKVFDRLQMRDGFKHTHLVYREKIMADAKKKGLKFFVAYQNEKPAYGADRRLCQYKGHSEKEPR